MQVQEPIDQTIADEQDTNTPPQAPTTMTPRLPVKGDRMAKDQPPSAPSTIDVEKLPPTSLLLLPEVAGLYRMSERTLQGKVSRHEFFPQPFLQYPYRWRAGDCAKDLRLKRELKHKKHGFAAKNAKPRKPR